MAPKKAAKARTGKAKAKAGPSEAEKEKVRNIFKEWDADGDGVINMPELTKLVVALGFPGDAVEPLFEKADLNKDGKVDVDEFLNWVYDAAPTAVQSFAKSGGAADKDAQKKFDEMLAEVFKCFDLDKDGLLERVELLDVTEKIYDAIGEVFNVKSRKATVAWFKDAGATGDPTSGMYLTYDKWRAAYVAALTEKAGATIAEPAKLSEYLYTSIAAKLFELTYPPAAASAPAAGAPADVATAAAGPPDYPLTIKFTELAEQLSAARRWERSALILSDGREEVETWLQYQQNQTLDCAKLIGEVFIAKTMTKEEATEKASGVLKLAMDSHGFCQPLHIRLNTSAFNLSSLCAPGKFPTECFSPALWTPDEAVKSGLMEEGHKMMVELEDFKKWKEFHVVISSKMGLEGANTHLFDKIPHYDELAILVIDPSSFAE